MGLWELFVLAVGLSMDAFSVAVCKGLSVCQIRKKQILTVGLYLVFFRDLCPWWAIFWELASRKKSRALITGSHLFFCPSSVSI